MVVKLTQEQINTEWTNLFGLFQKAKLINYYDMDALKEEISISPCTMQEDLGTSYAGALLVHMNLTYALAARLAKLVSGTFPINEISLAKVCSIMHLSKRYMFEPNNNEWEVKNRGLLFKFREMEGSLKSGERSALEALNNGVRLSVDEYEAITSLDKDEDKVKKFPYVSMLSVIVRQANEMAYAIENERFRKVKENTKK